MSKFNNRTGEIHYTNQGYRIEIIEYINSYNLKVQFDNGVTVQLSNYGQVTKGNINNPYHPSVENVGYIGVGKYETGTKIYEAWKGMFVRSYNKKYHKKFPSYIGCSVDSCWHCFQDFAPWFENNYVESYQLDKDILIKGNKIYSPETCGFIPAEINYCFVRNESMRTEYPIGVYKVGNRFVSYLKKRYLGSSCLPEKAFMYYKEAKEIEIKNLANKWKSKISVQMHQAMYNWIVEITD